MAEYYCNPLNIEYMYQIYRREDGSIGASREAADPSMVMFQDRYYIFPSMTHGFLCSDDMVRWDFFESETLPAFDYAPDVRVEGEWLYFCASTHENGVFYRTRDPFSDAYETIQGTFPFWNPNQFFDDDGRMYLYWGSPVDEPLYGIEMDPETLTPLGEPVPLVAGDRSQKGFERRGENHIPEYTDEERQKMHAALEVAGKTDSVPDADRGEIFNLSYIEGVWVNKHEGRYYLQYAQPGARFNIYNDAVYVSEHPLGPYRLADNNPFSYKPGGFIPGAGHGSTMEDRSGNVWHISTMRIFKNHRFERRIGL